MMMSAKKCEVNDLCNLDLCVCCCFLFLKRHAEHRPFLAFFYYLYFLLLEMQLLPLDSVEGYIY